MNQESSKLHIFRVKWQIPEAASIIEDSDAGGVIELCQESRLYVAQEGVRIRERSDGSQSIELVRCYTSDTIALLLSIYRAYWGVYDLL